MSRITSYCDDVRGMKNEDGTETLEFSNLSEKDVLFLLDATADVVLRGDGQIVSAWLSPDKPGAMSYSQGRASWHSKGAMILSDLSADELRTVLRIWSRYAGGGQDLVKTGNLMHCKALLNSPRAHRQTRVPEPDRLELAVCDDRECECDGCGLDILIGARYVTVPGDMHERRSIVCRDCIIKAAHVLE